MFSFSGQDIMFRLSSTVAGAPCHEIVPRLFLGNAASPKTQHFALVVNCTRDIPFEPHVSGIRLAVNDHPNQSLQLLALMEETHILERIHRTITSGHPVLVHCFAGMQRSCAVVACYLMRYHQMTAMQAVSFIRGQRPVAFFGGINFAQAIGTYERTWRASSSSSSNN